MATVRLYGGIGNQLFQFFAGYYVSQKESTPLTLDTRWTENHLSRGFPDLIEESTILEGKLSSIEKFYLKSKIILTRRFEFLTPLTRVSSPEESGYVDSKHLSSKNYLCGYYQSFRYIKPHLHVFETKLRSIKIDNPSPDFLRICKELIGRDFGFIHVRRGDYVGNQHYKELQLKYYEDAMKYLGTISKQTKTLVFSDDPIYAKYLFSKFPQLDIIDSSITDIETLFLMSQASFAIIANSTFSFWGALIGKEKVVVYPQDWFAEGRSPRELAPETWKSL